MGAASVPHNGASSGSSCSSTDDSPPIDIEKADIETPGREENAAACTASASGPKDDAPSLTRNLSRALSRPISRTSGPDPGPPPDGGLRAWTQVAAGHLAIINSWGLIQSYGVFQAYYTGALQRPPSDISWVGSVQIFLLFFLGTFAGRATDAGYFRAVFLAGSALQLVGVFTASAATRYWQLFLAQGLCQGAGNGLLFVSLMSLLASYFRRHRALAMSLVACGTSTGGMLWPGLVTALLPRLGFPWTLRVVGFAMLALQALAVAGLRPRLPPRRAGPLLDAAAFREPAYALFAAGMFLALWSCFFAFYYVGSFARDALGAGPAFATAQLITMNGLGIPGRLIPAAVADRAAGPLNLLVVVSGVTAVLLFAWIRVGALGGLFAWAAVYGFFASGIMGLFPPTLSNLTPDLSKNGVRMGMTFSIVSFACLTGPPIGGALVQKDAGEYLYAQIFAGSSMVAATAFLVMARVAKTGWRLRVKI